MYFWSINKLTDDLIFGISEKEVFKYFLLWMTFLILPHVFHIAITPYLDFFTDVKTVHTTIDPVCLYGQIFALAIFIVSLLLCFKINKKNFLNRFFPIQIVLYIRFAVLLFLLFFLSFLTVKFLPIFFSDFFAGVDLFQYMVTILTPVVGLVFILFCIKQYLVFKEINS